MSGYVVAMPSPKAQEEPNPTGQIANVQQQLEELRRDRQQLLKEIDIKQTKIYLLSDSHNAMKDGQRAYAELEENYRKLETSYRQLVTDYQGLEKTFRNVTSSYSWRLTSPLRRALKIVRRGGPQPVK